MEDRNFKFLISGALLCGLLSACSQEPTASYNTRKFLDLDTPVTDADRRAARLLSLSNNGAVQAISDPYQAAVSCVVSLRWLADQVRVSHVANEEQLRGLDAAIKIYRQRAVETGKSAAELGRDIELRRAGDVGDGQQARLALACIRQLG